MFVVDKIVNHDILVNVTLPQPNALGLLPEGTYELTLAQLRASCCLGRDCDPEQLIRS